MKPDSDNHVPKKKQKHDDFKKKSQKANKDFKPGFKSKTGFKNKKGNRFDKGDHVKGKGAKKGVNKMRKSGEVTKKPKFKSKKKGRK